MASDAPPPNTDPIKTDPTTTKPQAAAAAAAPVLAPAPAPPTAEANPSKQPKLSTLAKMGFAQIPPAADGGALALTTPLPSPAAATPPAEGPRSERHERTKMLATHKSSSMLWLQAAKKRRKPWYRPSLVRLLRLAQLLMVLRWTVPVLQMYHRGSICPYAVICSTGFVEIGLLCVSKITALLMYPLVALVFLSKCATLRTFVQNTCVSACVRACVRACLPACLHACMPASVSIPLHHNHRHKSRTDPNKHPTFTPTHTRHPSRYIAEVMNLYGLHELHVQFGYELALLTCLHAAAHIVRYALHDPALLACPAAKGGRVTLSGYIATALMLLVVASLGWDWLKRRVGFEPRKAVHMLSVPMLVALCFHHQRLLATCAALLVAYLLDWAYAILFKTHRVDDPRLFPIGNGALVEFRLPPGFECRSGQYIFVCAPYISKYEWHAFSAIPITHVDGSLGCSFYAQACGDWTDALLAAAHRNVRRPLWINGAYPSPFDTSVKFDYLFLVCTGIGITPGISVVSQYCHNKVIILLWVCRSQELIDLYRTELQVVQTKVFYTGGDADAGTRVDGSVVYTTGRPDICGEIKNVILHGRPLDPRLVAQAEAQRLAPPTPPSFAATLAAAAAAAAAGGGGGNKTTTRWVKFEVEELGLGVK
jgi:hypothetical protein